MEESKDAAEEIEEAAEALKDAVEELKLPFGRWIIKLVVEKLLAPVIVPAVTAALTAVMGWYMIGQYQVQDQVKEEVEIRETTRELFREAVDRHRPVEPPMMFAPAPVPVPDDMEITLEELREAWDERYEDEDIANRRAFPVELMQQQIQLQKKR